MQHADGGYDPERHRKRPTLPSASRDGGYDADRSPDLRYHQGFCDDLNEISSARDGSYICELVALEGAYYEIYKELRIPGRSGHPYRWHPATHSDLIRPGIPGYPATPKFTWFKLLRGDL